MSGGERDDKVADDDKAEKGFGHKGCYPPFQADGIPDRHDGVPFCLWPQQVQPTGFVDFSLRQYETVTITIPAGTDRNGNPVPETVQHLHHNPATGVWEERK